MEMNLQEISSLKNTIQNLRKQIADQENSNQTLNEQLRFYKFKTGKFSQIYFLIVILNLFSSYLGY